MKACQFAFTTIAQLEAHLAVCQEEWRSVPGYEGIYEVSDSGHLRSLDRIDCRGRRMTGRPLKQGKNRGGYFQVKLFRDRCGRTIEVHRVVAAAFLGVPLQGPDLHVHHGALGQTVNHLSNLSALGKLDHIAHHKVYRTCKRCGGAVPHGQYRLTCSNFCAQRLRVDAASRARTAAALARRAVAA